MFHLIPQSLHRALLPLAHRLRHRWRVWRKVPLTGCNVVICNLDGDVLLLRHSYGPRVWALPGGGVGRGEAPEDAVRREIREELDIALGRLTPVSVFSETMSGSPHTTHLFAATTDVQPRIDGREVIEARFFPRHSLPEPQGERTRARLDAWRAFLQGSP